jgi:hypothetical protein
MSQGSVNRTTEKDTSNRLPAHLSESQKSTPFISQPIYVVDMEDRDSMFVWEDKRGCCSKKIY